MCFNVEKFIKYSREHGECNLDGNYKRGNRAYIDLISTIKEIRSQDKDLTVLVPLLSHEDEAVRAWAATYLLPTNEDEAKAVLRASSLGDNIISVASSMILSQWEKKELKFAA